MTFDLYSAITANVAMIRQLEKSSKPEDILERITRSRVVQEQASVLLEEAEKAKQSVLDALSGSPVLMIENAG
jgi:hypothetical protein